MTSNFMIQNTKLDLKPKRHHGYSAVLFVMGTLFPPLAVAARFGIGMDFFANLFLTICGYIPGHAHNFYVQNIRNNKNHARTPKWAQRYGLVDTTEIERKRKRSQWANRYNDRLPRSTLEGQDYEEGEVAGSNSRDDSVINGSSQNRPNEQYWNEEDERYYGANDSRSLDSGSAGGGRWHYPANFDDSVVALEADNGKKKKKVKKDRWARTEDAYSLPDDGSTKKKKKKKKKNHSTVGDSDSIDRRSNSTVDFPEDPEGGLYGDRYGGQRNENSNVPEPSVAIGGRQRDELDHEF